MTKRSILRREDDGLADELAFVGLGDIDSVRATARSTTNEGVLGRLIPATMADIGLGDLGGIGVGGGASKHTETLKRVNQVQYYNFRFR